jgi:hypothetical protein
MKPEVFETQGFCVKVKKRAHKNEYGIQDMEERRIGIADAQMKQKILYHG